MTRPGTGFGGIVVWFYSRLVQSIFLFFKYMSLDTVVNVITGLRGSILERGNEFFTSPYPSDRNWGPSSILFNRHLIYFSRIKCPGREVDHSIPSSVEMKKVRSHRSTSPLEKLWIQPASYSTRIGFYSLGYFNWCLHLTTHPSLELRLRMSGAIHPQAHMTL